MRAKSYVSIEFLTVFFGGLILFYFAAFRTIGIDNDSLVYESAIDYLDDGIYLISEPSFLAFASIAKFFNGEAIRNLLILYAAIAIPIKMFSIWKYSESVILSFTIYVCLFFLLHEFTQIRAGVSAAFFLLGYYDAVNGRRLKYITKIFVAFIFHYSSVVFLPLIFFSRHKLNLKFYFILPFILLPLALMPQLLNFLSWFFSFLPIELSQRAFFYINSIADSDAENGIGKFQLSVMVVFCIYAWMLSKTDQEKLSPFDIISFKYLSLSFVAYFFLSPTPIMAGRIFELMSVSLIYILPVVFKRITPNIFSVAMLIMWLFTFFFLVSWRLINF